MRTRVTPSGEPTVDVRFCLVFPRETISVPVVRRVLGDTLNKLGVDEESVADLLLAVTEACTNVLRHSGPGRRYEVVASVGRNRCVLEVVDAGRGFDPASLQANRPPARSVLPFRRRRAIPPAQWPYPPPAAPPAPSAMRYRLSRVRHRAEHRALAQLPESGRGLAIMRACVDDVTLRSRPGRGTVVSLQRRIGLRSDAPLAHPEAVALRDAG
jgi:anti-sigma regulatory factor (Ser/Thr protein kinase)